MSTPEIGLSHDGLQGVIALLNDGLADQHVLYIKLRNYHWNVTGPRFYMLHGLFEAQYDQIAEAIDETAERVRALGGRPLSTMREFLDNSQLTEAPGVYPDADSMVANLLADHEAVIRKLRSAIEVSGDAYDDQGTADHFTELIQAHEKMAWMLRVTLEK